MTFSEVAQEWFETHKGAIAYSTQVNYRCCINLLSSIHGLKFEEIKYANLQKVINDKHAEGYSKSQLHKLKVVITQIYRHALIQEYIEKNPSLLLTLPSGLKYNRRNAISATSIEKILKFNHEYQLYFLTLFYTGIRRGEALALQWQDIDFDKKVMRICKAIAFKKNIPIIKEPKTENGFRIVPVPDKLLNILIESKGCSGNYIFTQKTTGKLHTHTSFKKMHKRWLTDLKAAYPDEPIENITSHMFRHNYITALFENNLPDYVVKEIVGHSDAAFTKRQYYHLSKSYLESSFREVRNIFLSKGPGFESPVAHQKALRTECLFSC